MESDHGSTGDEDDDNYQDQRMPESWFRPGGEAHDEQEFSPRRLWSGPVEERSSTTPST